MGLLKKLTKPGSGKVSGGLIQAVEFLVSRGHRLYDVLNVYTMDQIEAFQLAVVANRKIEMYEELMLIRTAYHGDKRAVTDLIRGLKARPKARSDADATISPQQAARLKMILGGKKV